MLNYTIAADEVPLPARPATVQAIVQRYQRTPLTLGACTLAQLYADQEQCYQQGGTIYGQPHAPLAAPVEESDGFR